MYNENKLIKGDQNMLNFNFYSPTYFAFGKGKELDCGTLVKRFGGSKVLLHYGGGSIKRNGVYDNVVKSLKEADIEFVELGGVQPNPRSGLVYEGIELCRKENVDFILAVGGGSTIDSAKAIAAGVPYEGDFWDYYAQDKTVDVALPVGTVLTIAAAGSEGSGDSVITHEESNLKWSTTGDAIRPKFSVLNPEFTMTLPAYQTACGICDIMVHVCERYFTNTPDVTTTDYLCEAILQAMIEEGRKVIANPLDYEARANVMWAGMVAHNNIVGVGREQDWASHVIEHELSAMYDCAHGAGLAVVMPSWMKYVYKQDIDRFARFAKNVWHIEEATKEESALKAIEATKNFFAEIGLPVTMDALGAKREDVSYMVTQLEKIGGAGNFVKLTGDDIRTIYESAFE